jgi:ectoine hydroxylase-related dioxygenase (phytanoyl-CoA dioxygenase family)
MSATEVGEAIAHLTTYGYCVLEDRISAETAESMAERFLELHDDPDRKAERVGHQYYQTLFGMMNRDDRVWSCASHPDVVAVAKHFLGEKMRVVEACSKSCWPGAAAGVLHIDSGSLFHELPRVPWLINTIWMLTEFTEDNGATGMVPLSHLSGMKKPPPEYSDDSPFIKAITGKPGSVAMWHGGTFHQNRANSTDRVRLGLNIPYSPPWFNNWIEGGHQPVWPETFERMPPEMQRLCPGRLARHRDEAYEVRR